MRLLAVDPGLKCTGVAVFEGSRLIRGFAVRGPTGGDNAERARVIASEVQEKAGAVDRVVYEWPQVYRFGRGKGDPNDLLALVAIGSAVAALYPGASVESVKPAEWKGQRTKEAMRGVIVTRLDPDELSLLTYAPHDTWDAVGIGLWALGRLERKRTLAGTT